MILNLTNILHADGEKQFINDKIDLSNFSGMDDFEITQPVKIDGFIQNIGSSLELCAKVTACLQFKCDRCGIPVENTIEFDLLETLKKEDEHTVANDGEVIYFEGTRLEISDIIYRNLFMNIPMKNLCREDCKGLCSVCGRSLNEQSCSCSEEADDPRLAALDKFFEK